MRCRVTRAFSFEAAHELPWHSGKCKRLHGHSYRFEVTVEGEVGDNGIVIDFEDLKRIVKAEVVDRYDHQFLNDFLDNPTAELLADDIAWRLIRAALPVVRVRLWETPDSSVEVEFKIAG